MSTSLTLTLLKGCSEQELRGAIEVAVGELNGRVSWGSDDPAGVFLGVSSREDIHSVHLGYWESHSLLKRVGARLGCVWIEARIQVSSHWDYSLMRGKENLHNFSTLPEHFSRDPEHLRRFRGDPEELAVEWGVPLERITGYLKQWGDDGEVWEEGALPGMRSVGVDPETGDVAMRAGVRRTQHVLAGKAYPTDEYGYGDFWQLLDFVRALGGDQPPAWSPGEMGGRNPQPGARHRLFFPDNSDIYGTGWPKRSSLPFAGPSWWTRVKQWLGGGCRIDVD